MIRKDSFDRFWDKTLAAEALEVDGAIQPVTRSISMLVGSAGRDVIILGEIPAGALEMILGRGRDPAPSSPD